MQKEDVNTMTKKQNVKKISEWQKLHTKIINFRVNKTTDVDIIERLEQVGGKTPYIKQLIREDIRRQSGYNKQEGN